MKKEIDTRLAAGVIAVLVVLIGAFAWWKFAPRSGQLTAAEAGMGKPMQPGEIPGKQQGVSTPNQAPSNK